MTLKKITELECFEEVLEIAFLHLRTPEITVDAETDAITLTQF
jgi:hypothetical protein